MGWVNDKKFQYYGSSLENPMYIYIYIYGVNRLKRGPWIVCRFKRGLGKRRGHVFWGGEGLRPQRTLWHKHPTQITLQHSIITNNINYNWHIVSQKSQKKEKKGGLLIPKIPNSRLVKVWNCGVRK